MTCYDLLCGQETNTFIGFKSLCTTFAECKYLRSAETPTEVSAFSMAPGYARLQKRSEDVIGKELDVIFASNVSCHGPNTQKLN